jgi:hypothetical protein
VRQARTRFYIEKQKSLLENRPNYARWLEVVAFEANAKELADKCVVYRPTLSSYPCSIVP